MASIFRGSSTFWALLALAGETALYFWFHPVQNNPVAAGLVLFLNGLAGIGLIFQLGWVRWFSFVAILLLLGLWFGTALANGSSWEGFFALGCLFTIISCYAPCHWSYPLVVLDPVYDEQADEYREPAFARRLICWFLPRSRLALFEAQACACFGMMVYEYFREADLAAAGVALMLPEMVLAGTFWFHQRWVRWYGPLLMLGWAGLSFWAVNVNGFDPTHVGNYFAILFVVAGLRLRRVSW